MIRCISFVVLEVSLWTSSLHWHTYHSLSTYFSSVPVGAKMFQCQPRWLVQKGWILSYSMTWMKNGCMIYLECKDGDGQSLNKLIYTPTCGNWGSRKHNSYQYAPVVQEIEEKYGGGFIYKYTTESEQIKNIGFEGLRLESTYASEEDEEHGWIGIVFSGIKNGWVRQVTGLHFAYGLVSAQSRTSFVTIEDSAKLDHKSEIRGGRRCELLHGYSVYLFLFGYSLTYLFSCFQTPSTWAQLNSSWCNDYLLEKEGMTLSLIQRWAIACPTNTPFFRIRLRI